MLSSTTTNQPTTSSPTTTTKIHSYIISLRATDIPSHTIQATAGIILQRNDNNTNKIHLNARGLSIQSVCVNEHETTFRVRDYLAKLVGDKVSKDLQTLSACLTGDVDGATEGEFEIDIPTVCMNEIILTLEIEYTIDDNGLIFALVDHNNNRDAHVYTRNGFCNTSDLGAGCGARTWFPCLDVIQAVSSFKLQIEVLPSHICIATGLLTSKRPLPNSVLYEFVQSEPLPPYCIGFVVGPFFKSPTLTITSGTNTSTSNTWLTSYILSSRAHLLQRYESENGKSFNMALNALQSYVRSAESTNNTNNKHAQIFVARETSFDICMPFTNLSILSDELLLGSFGKTRANDIIQLNPSQSFLLYANKTEDVEMSLFWRMVGITSSQWFGYHRIFPCTVADVWIPTGLAMLSALECIRVALGEASYHIILSNWTRRVVEGERRAAQVLYYSIYKKPGFVMARSLSRPKPYSVPVDAVLWSSRGLSLDSFFACKAGLVVRMIEQRITPNVFKECIRRLVKRQHFLTETAFLTSLKARDPINTRDITYTFVSQWLRHSGMPKFKGIVEYNTKKNSIQVMLQQIVNPGGRVYMGAIKIRVVETGGTWEYEKQIDNVEHRWTFECRSKKSTIHKKRGRKSGDEERRAMELERWRSPEKLQTIELLNFALKTSSQQWWDNDSTVRYVVLDPDRAWIMDLEWTQPEAFWLELLNEGTSSGGSASSSTSSSTTTSAGDNISSGKKSISANVSLLTFAMDQISAGRVIKNVGGMREMCKDNIRLAAVLASEFFRKSIHVPYCRRYACEALLKWHEVHERKSAHACSLFLEIYKSLFVAPNGDPYPLDYSRRGEQAIRSFSLHVLSRFRDYDGAPSMTVKELILDAIRKYDSKEDDDSAYRAGLVRAAGELAITLKHQSMSLLNADHFLSSTSNTTSMVSSLELDAEVDELVKFVQNVLDLSLVAAEGRRLEEIGVSNHKLQQKHQQQPHFLSSTNGGDDDDKDDNPTNMDQSLSTATRNATINNVHIPDTRPELACLDALCKMEMNEIIPFRTTKFASFVEDVRWSRDPASRLTGFSCILRLYVIHRAVKGASWMEVVRWLFRQACTDPCYKTRVEMMKLLLSAHADTVSLLVPELGDGQQTSTAGCYWPLMQPEEDMKEPNELEQARLLAQAVWDLINHKSSFHSPLRILAHQFWRMIWQFDPIPFWQDAQMVIPELGELENWVDVAEKAFASDEQKTMIRLEDVEMMKRKQSEIVDEKERVKRERLEMEVVLKNTSSSSSSLLMGNMTMTSNTSTTMFGSNNNNNNNSNGFLMSGSSSSNLAALQQGNDNGELNPETIMDLIDDDDDEYTTSQHNNTTGLEGLDEMIIE
jgi:hypothetical protein